MRNFETFFYNPSVAVQMENESLRNVVILQYENDKRTKSSESVIPSVERDLAESLERRYSSGKLKFPSSQPTLSYRVGPARDP